jgi:hypothetical protein
MHANGVMPGSLPGGHAPQTVADVLVGDVSIFDE